MANDFYARWFSRTQPPQPSPEESWRYESERMQELAKSPMATELAERFEVPEIEAAETAFKQAIAGIADPEIRNRIDMAAGQISSAYQILGFCAGRFSQDSRAHSF